MTLEQGSLVRELVSGISSYVSCDVVDALDCRPANGGWMEDFLRGGGALFPLAMRCIVSSMFSSSRNVGTW